MLLRRLTGDGVAPRPPTLMVVADSGCSFVAVDSGVVGGGADVVFESSVLELPTSRNLIDPRRREG